MNRFLKIFIPVFALAGVTLLAIGQGKNIALLMLFYLMPIILIYALYNTKNELSRVNTKFKLTLFTIIITNTIFISLRLLLKIQHFPGVGILDIVCVLLSIISLIVGLIYFIKNRDNINTTFTYELILILFPTLMFMWRYTPFNFYNQSNIEQKTLIMTSINQLESINITLKDTSCRCSEIEFINELKQDLIVNSGGLNETGEIINFYSKSAQVVIKQRESDVKKLNVSIELLNQLIDTRITGEAVFILTQIENELIVRNCIKE